MTATINETAAVMAAASLRVAAPDIPQPRNTMDITSIDTALNNLLDVATNLVTNGHPIPDSLADSIRDLHAMLDDALDASLTDSIGCSRFNPDATPTSLSEPALVFVGGDFYHAHRVEVYIPGHHYTPLTATSTAIHILTEYTQAMFGMQPDTRYLTAAVTSNQWARLIPCEGIDHDWHPIPAEEHTRSATAITKVTLEATSN